MIKLLKTSQLFVVMGLFFLAGCQTTTGYYKGAVADQDTVVEIGSANSAGIWKDLYIDVNYVLQQQGETLNVEGSFAFAEHPRGMLGGVRDFRLKLFLLDQDHRVLDYADLARSLGQKLDVEVGFKRTFQMPAGTVAISFGYEGVFIEESEPAGSVRLLPWRENVWKLPKRSN